MGRRTIRAATLVTLFAAPLATDAAPSLLGQSVSVDTAGLGAGPHSRMHMLLERTIFKVDVLTLDVRFGPTTAGRIEALLARPLESGPLADSITAAALEAHDVLARIEFQRNVRLEQFLDGIRDNLRRATRAGIVTPAEFQSISEDLPGWYASLSERGIRSGDLMLQRVRGDTLRTAYVGTDGDVLLDQVDIGPAHRLAVLGGYFAPGSEFRRGLVESVLASRATD